MSRIVEFFGYDPADKSYVARGARRELFCPFQNNKCTKTLNDGLRSGACTIQQTKDPRPVVICPVRLYADDYRILRDVCDDAFGVGTRLLRPDQLRRAQHDGRNVVYLGKNVGRELKLPTISGRGGFFVDWVLARLSPSGSLVEFVAVEVQSIDTNGNYRSERAAYLAERPFQGNSTANPNWENVSKRILPQLIYKANVLQLERMCNKGLYFICPEPVFKRIETRLGSNLVAYPPRPGTVTFRWYDPVGTAPAGQTRNLVFGGQFTTTVEQIALGFTAPRNLPPANSYERLIEGELRRS